MQCLYLLVIFIFLGVDGKQSTDKEKNVGTSFQTTLQNHENASTINIDLGLNTDQARDLEKAVNNVAKKLLGPQIGNLSLRNTENPKTGLRMAMRRLSDVLCENLIALSRSIALLRPTSIECPNYRPPNSTSLNRNLYFHLLRFPLIIAPIYRQARTKINNHLRKVDYKKMGYKSSSFSFQMNYGGTTDQLKITAFFGAMSIYGSNAYKCLDDRQPDSFDLKKAIGNLTSSTPEIMGKRLKNRFAKPIPKSPGRMHDEYNQIQALVCHAVTEDSFVDYRKCLVEMKRIDNCIKERLNATSKSEGSSARNSKDFLRTIKSIDDSCKNADKGMDVVVACNLKTKTTRTNAFPTVVEFFMGDLKKSPELSRMAKRVGSMIAKNRETSEALDEVVTLIKIYKQGAEKKARLMKAARNNVVSRSIFSRISNVLSDYKKHIYDVTYRTVSHVHNVMSTVQKLLVDSASTLVGEDLTSNTRALRSWSGFSESVVTSWGTTGRQFPTLSPHHRIVTWHRYPYDEELYRSKSVIKVPTEVDSMKSVHSKPLNELIVSMKHLGQPGPPRRSALVSIANTFLLATMFYECLSLLAGAIYCTDSNPVSSSIDVETNEPDHWQSSRDRRSPSPIDRDDLQPERPPVDQQKPLWPTVQPDRATAATADHEYERTQESVGNLSDEQIPESIHTYENVDHEG